MRTRLATLLALLAAGCASGNPAADAGEETGVDAPFGQVPEDEGKLDGVTSRGPRIGNGAATEVWAVERGWDDTTEDGLTYEEAYDAWVASMTTEARHHGSGQTFIIPTPYGDRRLHAPTLECAEVALLLRATFASWHHLPFYLSGWDARGRQTFYAGHFGFVNGDGQRVANFPSFRSRYRDYEGDWSPGDEWPRDASLRGLRLGDDDAVEFLSEDGEEVGAGAYFDELFLNKRVGYFMRLLLLYFGSANLADGSNMFHVRPEATAAGDILVHRWQKRGIGHVMPIFRVERHAEDALEITIASGSMPRREPVWEEPNTARSRFTSSYAGGEGESSDGDAYATLGGGVRRWRTAVRVSGRWQNIVSEADRDDYLADSDREAIAARPGRFEEILRSLSVEERRDVALAGIEAAREHLRMYPASCAARIRREDAFEDLYEALGAQGQTRAQVDAAHRSLEDYVFAALVYDQSRTCCWNRSTAAMHGAIMDYAEQEQTEAERDGMCLQPTVFMAHEDGYARWAAHAAELGVAWNDWSEDESCSQRDVPSDTVDAERAATSWCELGAAPEPTEPTEPPAGAGCDATGAGSQASATRLGLASARNAEICGGDEDWYLIDATGGLTVRIDFAHADGDLDLEAVAADGRVLDRSAGVQDSETVEADGPFYVRVYGYSGAENVYTIVAQ